MSLDLSHVLPQVHELGRFAAQHAVQVANLLPIAVNTFHEVAEVSKTDLESVMAKIGQQDRQWRGARPTKENIDLIVPPPPSPAQLNVIGADGSQIYIDRHSIFLYYLINIGSIWIQYGSGNPPQTFSHPNIYFEEHDLYDHVGLLLSPSLVNKKRDVAEMATLAHLAEKCSGEPTLTLLDNTLTLQAGDRGRLTKIEGRLFQDYLQQLQRLKLVGSAIAGFIDRPRSRDLLSFLSLIGWDQPVNRFRGLTDRDLLSEILPTYHRSALFHLQSPEGYMLEHEGHSIIFFYLHAGAENQIVRIEIPEWVANQPSLINWVHAGILKDCQATNGFPYSLIRAHELALVSDNERRALDQWLSTVLLRHGLQPKLTQKAATKRWLGKPRHHRLTRRSL